MPRDRRIDISGLPREILEMVIDVVPELRICALALHRLRQKEMKLPVTSPQDLVALLEEEAFVKEGHSITEDDIPQFMTGDLFPIESERDFVGRVYLGLLRCRSAARYPLTNKTWQEFLASAGGPPVPVSKDGGQQ